MTPHLDQARQALIDTVRGFVRSEILPLEDGLGPDADEVSEPVLARLMARTKQMGLYNFQVPTQFGGPGLDLETQTLISIEISQHRAGLYSPGYGSFGASGAAVESLFNATAEQRARYLDPVLRGEMSGFFALTESSGGSDPSGAVRMRAHRVDGGWRLSGSKLYITGVDKAQFGLVFARTADDAGEGVTCFIVGTHQPGFSIRRVVHTLSDGHKAFEIDLDDVPVEERNVLGAVHHGLRVAGSSLTRQRIPYAARCIGVAAMAQRMALDWARQRRTFGAPLSSRQAIQWMLVDNDIDIRHATWAALDAARAADSGRPFRLESAVAKLVCTEAAGRVVDRCIQVFGGAGVTTDLPLERWYREMRIRRIGEGASEVQRMIIARSLLGATCA